MTRVLFVDDETAVLEGLRDSLRPKRREWKMTFALGAEAAIEQLQQDCFDVVVSDMRMPVMDGAALLALVQREHPDTFRVILSGYAESESALRSASVAHVFLAKPCNVESLWSSVERGRAMQSLLHAEGLRRDASGIGSLPSRPAAYTRLKEVLASPDSTQSDIARILEEDMAMSAKVLQLVNSAFFGLGRRVTSVRDAVAYLGLTTLEALVVSSAVFQVFAPSRNIAGFDIEELQRHGTLVGRIAKGLVPDRAKADEAFTAGALHDIGKLVLAAEEPDLLAAALTTARATGEPLHAIEAKLRGSGHAEVGAYLLGLWGLPHTVVEAVAHHHAPERAGGSFDVATAVYVANRLVREAGACGAGASPGEPLDEELLTRLGVHDRLPEWRRMAAEKMEALGAAGGG
jgi:HD-like signal output (HDOD) protein